MVVETIWKPVVGRFEGWPYKISSNGQVQRTKAATNTFAGKILLQRERKGYLTVSLCYCGKIIYASIHVLIMEAFVCLRPNEQEVNHIDGIKTNNSLENLEWVSRSDNHKHAYRMGLSKTTNNNGILTIEDIRNIRRLLEKGDKQKEIALIYGVNFRAISRIKLGTTYTDVV